MSNPRARRGKSWSKPLSELMAPCLTPSLARFGFAQSDLLLFWPAIVGERLAGRCEPMRLQWPSRGRVEATTPTSATLLVRVEGAFALELQHQSAQVIERVNGHLGWRCVDRLLLRQGPVIKPPPARQAVPPPDRAAVQEAHAVTAGIDEDGLRRALIRLGGRVLSR